MNKALESLYDMEEPLRSLEGGVKREAEAQPGRLPLEQIER